MRKRIVLIHGTKVIVNELDKLFSETTPNAEVLHLVDEGILELEEKGPRKQLARRLCNLVVSAEESGADVIMITDTAGIPFVSMVQTLVDAPVMQITLPMIEAAVDRGETIGLVATEKVAADAIVELLHRTAEQRDKKITVKVGLCEEAFKARLSGNVTKHDELVIKKIVEVSKTVDIIALAQVSIARVVPKLKGKIDRPVLSPPRVAVEKVRSILA